MDFNIKFFAQVNDFKILYYEFTSPDLFTFYRNIKFIIFKKIVNYFLKDVITIHKKVNRLKFLHCF